MPINGSVNPPPAKTAAPGPNYQPAPQQPAHPGYGGGEPVVGHPLSFSNWAPPPQQQQQEGVCYAAAGVPPPPPLPQQQQQQPQYQPQYQQQNVGSFPVPATNAYAYPSMPDNAQSPASVIVDNYGNTSTNWAALVLQFPVAPNGSPVGFPPNPSQPPACDPRWKLQSGNATDEILENRICVGIKLKDCELRNCYVVDCVVKDSLCKGGYYSTCKLKECEFQNTLVIISCVMDDSIAKWSGITNTQIREGDLQKCNTLDSKVIDSNVWGGTAIRCEFRKCGVQAVHQEQCNISECSTSANKSVP